MNVSTDRSDKPTTFSTVADHGEELSQYLGELQVALTRGWERLKSGPEFARYTEAFEFFRKVGLYEGLFRPEIPNPVYDNAAKQLGREFLERSVDLGLAYKDLFPGDFSLSTEATLHDLEYRVFKLTAYMAGRPVGTFKLSFEHCHDRFDFPRAPTLELL